MAVRDFQFTQNTIKKTPHFDNMGPLSETKISQGIRLNFIPLKSSVDSFFIVND